ncbi:thioredoxin family protein [Arenibacter aquaticus]|uniref:Thioredoxin family protein n=1 Tax=Arenibacter aquaticus TaxID=2489054 RepID=A0A430K643_9FLAO|nr:thioredoxin family protein [Arenibacter aquaticus]RTE54479.1 thioredoxin family protein [Arenibacter aquaticus]
MEQETLQKETTALIEEGLEKAMGYNDYRSLMATLALEGKSTGKNQNEELANYTLLNERRMKRLDKTIKVDADTETKIKDFDKKVTWLVLTESWCGDAAQTIPVMNKLAVLNDHISLKLLLRDENVELMQRFLSNGAKAIPKLIAVDGDTTEVIGEWGSRPTAAAKMVMEEKANFGRLRPEFKQTLQQWYNKDKGQNTIKDLLSMLFLK